MEQRAHGGRRFVDQGLLMAIEHFITHGDDNRARLTLATGAQFHQSLHDGLRAVIGAIKKKLLCLTHSWMVYFSRTS